MGVDDDGLIDTRDRSAAIVASGFLALVVALALAIWLTKGGAAAFGAWSAIGFTTVIFLCAVIAFRCWSDHRRFGSSRLVPDRPDVRPGETLTATLEAAPGLANAREVRFELVETHITDTFAAWGEQVRATATVAVSAFQVVPGFTRIPVSLAVPADGWASFKRTDVGFSLANTFIIGKRETEHAWEVRAAAEVDGARYRAKFRVTIATVRPIEPEPPYTPRPIGIPQSDKRRPPEVK